MLGSEVFCHDGDSNVYVVLGRLNGRGRWFYLGESNDPWAATAEARAMLKKYPDKYDQAEIRLTCSSWVIDARD